MKEGNRAWLFRILYLILAIMVLVLPYTLYKMRIGENGEGTVNNSREDYPKIINIGIVGIMLGGVFVLLYGKNKYLDFIFLIILTICVIIALFLTPKVYLGT